MKDAIIITVLAALFTGCGSDLQERSDELDRITTRQETLLNEETECRKAAITLESLGDTAAAKEQIRVADSLAKVSEKLMEDYDKKWAEK